MSNTSQPNEEDNSIYIGCAAIPLILLVSCICIIYMRFRLKSALAASNLSTKVEDPSDVTVITNIVSVEQCHRQERTVNPAMSVQDLQPVPSPAQFRPKHPVPKEAFSYTQGDFGRLGDIQKNNFYKEKETVTVHRNYPSTAINGCHTRQQFPKQVMRSDSSAAKQGKSRGEIESLYSDIAPPSPSPSHLAPPMFFGKKNFNRYEIESIYTIIVPRGLTNNQDSYRNEVESLYADIAPPFPTG